MGLKKEIGPKTILRRDVDLLFNQIDGEVVMLSIENSKYYGMDKVGSRIWELLENPLTFKELVNILMDEYNVSEDKCTNDTLCFLVKLRDRKLLLHD